MKVKISNIMLLSCGMLFVYLYAGLVSRQSMFERKETELQLKKIEEAINKYYEDTGYYPQNDEGLNALLSTHPTDDKTLARHSYGYIFNIPVDAWGTPYHYRYRSDGPFVILSSSGPDKKMATRDDIYIEIKP